MKLLKPYKLKKGDNIGVFTPSSPAYCINEELFVNGLQNLEKCGFKTKLGFLTAQRAHQGYRSGSAKERAREFMELIYDTEVHALMSTIGGANSNSLIPYLDFAAIRDTRKIICGYSDVTSLHLAILKYSGLKTLYGPAVMTWFGEYPDGVAESTQSFLQATTDSSKERLLKPFVTWSNHCRNWQNGDWKNIPREWQRNKGWRVLNPGQVQAEVVVANLNTLMSAAGTEYFPCIEGKILVVEEMFAPLSRTERSLRQLQLMGVFDKIVGFVMGKVEKADNEGAPFVLDDLLLEIIEERAYPIISEFDCAHTIPMHTIGQRSKVYIEAKCDYEVLVKIQEPFVV